MEIIFGLKNLLIFQTEPGLKMKSFTRSTSKVDEKFLNVPGAASTSVSNAGSRFARTELLTKYRPSLRHNKINYFRASSTNVSFYDLNTGNIT